MHPMMLESTMARPLEIAIETRVLQRDRGLRRQQFQDRDSSRRERV